VLPAEAYKIREASYAPEGEGRIVTGSRGEDETTLVAEFIRFTEETTLPPLVAYCSRGALCGT